MPSWFRSSNGRFWAWLAALSMGLSLIGCGADDIAPPPPPELVAAERGNTPGLVSASSSPRTDLLGTAGTGVKSIEIILDPRLHPRELEVEANSARVQAGFDKARIHLPISGEEAESPGPESAAGATRNQAKLVRESLARRPRPQAIIIEPSNPPDKDLAQAIQEVQAAKIPLILVSRPLSTSSGSQGGAPGSSPIVVRPQPFTNSARLLVAAAIRNAKNAKLDPKNGAILLIDAAGDGTITDRIAAVRSALAAAGVQSVQELRYTLDSQAAEKLLTERLKADRKPVLVFAFDHAGATGSNAVAAEIAPERPFIQAAYTSDESLIRMANAGEFAALAYYVPMRLIRRAVSVAVAIVQKQEVTGPLEIPIVVHESPPDSGAPHMQAEMKSRAKTKGEHP